MAEGSQSGNGHWTRAINKGTAIAGRDAGSNRIGAYPRGASEQTSDTQTRGGYLIASPHSNKGKVGIGVYSNSGLGGAITGSVNNGAGFPWEVALKYVMGKGADVPEGAIDEAPRPAPAVDTAAIARNYLLGLDPEARQEFARSVAEEIETRDTQRGTP